MGEETDLLRELLPLIERYVHLLPSGHGQSKREGDAAEMVRARRRFLEGGHYRPLSDALNEIAAAALRPSGEGPPGPSTVLEAGCGEGYYIGRLASALPPPAGGAGHCFLAFDLSKEAVRLAARKHRDVFFFLNDVTHRLSVADAAVDLLLDLFAPRNPHEFARVVRRGGALVVAIPEADHLIELREALPLLGLEEDKRERTVERLGAAFELVEEEVVRFRPELSGDDVLDLLRMTPNYWHLDPATMASAAQRAPQTVTISARLLAFRRGG